MKFQDTSIHRLKVKKKWCGHTDTRKHGHTDKPKAICPTNFFKVGGIKNPSIHCIKIHSLISNDSYHNYVIVRMKLNCRIVRVSNDERGKLSMIPPHIKERSCTHR